MNQIRECTKCGIIKPLVSGFHKAGKHQGHQKYMMCCKICRSERGRRYYKANRDKIAEAHRRYREMNPEKTAECLHKYYIEHREEFAEKSHQYYLSHQEELKARRQQYCKENKEKIAIQQRRYKAKNPEKVKEYYRQYHKKNKDRIAAYFREYDKANPGKKRMKEYRRRGREAGSTGSFTEAQFQALCDYYANVCLRCGEPKPLTRDHIIPLIDGGSSDISNIQPLCHSCNSTKGTKNTDYRNILPSRENLCPK